MRRLITFVVLLAAAMLSGCAPKVEREAADTASREVLGILASDTLYFVRHGDSASLHWRRNIGRDWHSGSLLNARPDAELLFANEDSLPDLFFTIQWEEFIIGELWLGHRSEGIQAFESSERACRVPVLRDVNEDGRLDIIDYVASALEPSECYGDPLAAVCQSAYPTEWPVVWTQRTSGVFAADSLSAASYYEDMAADFASAAEALRTAIRDGAGPPAASPRCDEAMVNTLAAMASRAAAIGSLR